MPRDDAYRIDHDWIRQQAEMFPTSANLARARYRGLIVDPLQPPSHRRDVAADATDGNTTSAAKVPTAAALSTNRAEDGASQEIA